MGKNTTRVKDEANEKKSSGFKDVCVRGKSVEKEHIQLQTGGQSSGPI